MGIEQRIKRLENNARPDDPLWGCVLEPDPSCGYVVVNADPPFVIDEMPDRGVLSVLAPGLWGEL